MHPASPSSVKPEAPRLDPDVYFSEDDPLEATVQWTPPVWPPHKVLVCQFYYRRCQEMAWTLVSVRSASPSPHSRHRPQIRDPAQRAFVICPWSLSVSHIEGLYTYILQLKN